MGVSEPATPSLVMKPAVWRPEPWLLPHQEVLSELKVAGAAREAELAKPCSKEAVMRWPWVGLKGMSRVSWVRFTLPE